VYPDAEVLERVKLLDSYIKDEINVKAVDYVSEEEQFVNLKAQLNTKKLGKVLGPKLGSQGMNQLRKAIGALSTDDIRSVESGKSLELEGESLAADDLVIKREVKSGVKAAASSGQITIMLDTMLTSELRCEGIARDFVNRVQKLRKECDFEVTDRIVIKYMTACPHIISALETHADYVMEETLSVDLQAVTTEEEINPQTPGDPSPEAQEIEGKAVILALRRIQG
jgi:isoleucyl-tRNA synthetase